MLGTFTGAHREQKLISPELKCHQSSYKTLWIKISKRFIEESTETFKPVRRVGLLWLHLWLSFIYQLRRPTSENKS